MLPSHIDSMDFSSFSLSLLPYLLLYCSMMERRQRKNSQSRMRAQKHKERIAGIMAKPMELRTEEERRELSLYEERRARKNERSRSRSSEKKDTVEVILAKPESKRNKVEMAFLEQALAAKQRKNEGDRLRRERLKLLGFQSYNNRAGGVTAATAGTGDLMQKKPRVTARGPLPPEYMDRLRNQKQQEHMNRLAPGIPPRGRKDHHYGVGGDQDIDPSVLLSASSQSVEGDYYHHDAEDYHHHLSSNSASGYPPPLPGYYGPPVPYPPHGYGPSPYPGSFPPPTTTPWGVPPPLPSPDDDGGQDDKDDGHGKDDIPSPDSDDGPGANTDHVKEKSKKRKGSDNENVETNSYGNDEDGKEQMGQSLLAV